MGAIATRLGPGWLDAMQMACGVERPTDLWRALKPRGFPVPCEPHGAEPWPYIASAFHGSKDVLLESDSLEYQISPAIYGDFSDHHPF